MTSECIRYPNTERFAAWLYSGEAARRWPGYDITVITLGDAECGIVHLNPLGRIIIDMDRMVNRMITNDPIAAASFIEAHDKYKKGNTICDK